MRTDVLLSEEFDLIDQGDEWAEGESDQQHVQLLMLASKGDIKEFPFVGFGAVARLRSVYDRNKITREIKVELEADGYQNPTLIMGTGLDDLRIEI